MLTDISSSYASDGGSNQSRVRAYNERLVLSLVRRHDELSKPELVGYTGLSLQTVSVIVRSLESDGLLVRGSPRRGRVGQPSVPLRLNPDGAYSFGLKIGRRSADLVLTDFLGSIRYRHCTTYRFPDPSAIIDFACRGIDRMTHRLSDFGRDRVCGIGVAMPFELWNWGEELGVPPENLEAWRDFDVSDELVSRTGLDSYVQNDATSACGAELAFGLGAKLTDFVYFYVGTLVGGGVVLNNALYSGRAGYAGALGPMPVSSSPPSALLNHASLIELDRRIESSDSSMSQFWRDADDWSAYEDFVDEWINSAGYYLAVAAVTSCSVIDFESVVIDGAFPPSVRNRLVERVESSLDTLDLQGIIRPSVLAGTIGRQARAIGGASQPLFNKFLLDKGVLLNPSS